MWIINPPQNKTSDIHFNRDQTANGKFLNRSFGVQFGRLNKRYPKEKKVIFYEGMFLFLEFLLIHKNMNNDIVSIYYLYSKHKTAYIAIYTRYFL